MCSPAEAQAANPFETNGGTEPPDDGFDESLYQRPGAILPHPRDKPLSVPVLKMGFAGWEIPKHASKRAQNVASAISVMFLHRSADGWGLNYLTRRCALGKHQIAATAKRIGIKMSPNTAAAGLLDLWALGCLTRVGQREIWQDWSDDGRWKQGVCLYRLNGVTLRQIRKPQVGQSREGGSTSYGTLRSTRPRCSIHAALKWAKDWAKLGNRNETGRWLAWRCIEKGLAAGETWAVMGDYQRSVPQRGHAYTANEVRATVCHTLRRSAV